MAQTHPSQSQPAQSLSHPEARTPHAPDAHGAPGHGALDHVPGTMDVSAQERTFEGFMRVVTRAAVTIVAILILLALVNG